VKSPPSAETSSTIEFELTADELVRAGDSLHANQAVFARTSAPPIDALRPLHGARALRLPSRGTALAISVAVAALLCAFARQRIAKPAAQLHSRTTTLARETIAPKAAAPEIPSTPSSKPVPVRLANPFDDTEVFEFPPGTSLEYARATVAEFLIDRARDRHVRHAHRSRVRQDLRNS
jgi:hypothetical protein